MGRAADAKPRHTLERAVGDYKTGSAPSAPHLYRFRPICFSSSFGFCFPPRSTALHCTPLHSTLMHCTALQSNSHHCALPCRPELIPKAVLEGDNKYCASLVIPERHGRFGVGRIRLKRELAAPARRRNCSLDRGDQCWSRIWCSSIRSLELGR
jgi:hypothetical protein